ncbi:MAG: Response regulator receiver [Proteobacteria bacterium]|nr:Response regulator receiver [Pseudomonadota bacterium]
MTKTFRIAIVDDNPPQRMILSRLLEKDYAIEQFENGAQFLASDTEFDAVLLDIEMPDPNGYDTCRRFRNLPRGNETPVIFVSAHDTTPERVAAYEAGGDDFVTKPIAAHELRHKLHTTLEHRERIRALTSQSSDAQKIAFSAMSSMGDLGAVIEFLRKSAQATTYTAIAARLIAAMQAWGLQGAVQVRGRHETVNLTAEGPMTAMQTAVLEKLRDIGRTFEMGSRAVINFDQVSLLIENLPIDNPEKVGRLRDHLGVLAESADMRMAALDATMERDLRKLGIEAALGELKAALQSVSTQSNEGHQRTQTALIESIEQLGRTIASLGLTETQTTYLDDLLRHLMDETERYFDEVALRESDFDELRNRLHRLAEADYRL